MNKLWTCIAAAEASGGQASGRWHATGVSIDSRTIQPGDLFVALRGKTQDAHAYVPHALAAGAAAAVVDRPVEGPHLFVADTGQALTALAIAARARSAAKITAITGSVGKTSSKEALTQLLAAQAPAYGTKGNLNNQLGVPLSLARLPETARFGIFELGMSHPGEIAPLSRLVKPHVALVTAIASAHVAAFADGEAGIALEKASIAEGLLPDGALILPCDSEYFPQMRTRHSKVLTFGTSSKADSRLLDWRPGSDGIDRIEAMILGQRCHYYWGMAGHHQALNSLAVLTALHYLGGDLSRALHDSAALHALAGHGDRLRLPWRGGMLTLLDESYNASPTAVCAALAVLAGLPARRLLILGDMLELGEQADAWHASLADAVNSGDFDRIYLAGSHVAALARALPKGRVTALASQTEELITPVLRELKPGDALLIKGSSGMKLRSLVEAIKTASTAQKVRSDVL